MKLFEPYEIELKTGRTMAELQKRFSRRAEIKGNKFYIYSEPYSLVSRTEVVGEIIEKLECTEVSFEIHASLFMKVFSYIWLGGFGIALLTFVIKALIQWQYHPAIHGILLFGLVGYVITQLTFKTSADAQEQSVRQMIRAGE